MNPNFAFNPLTMEIEYSVSHQVDTPVQRQNVETGEIFNHVVKQLKPISKGILTLPMDKFDKSKIELELGEYEDCDEVWQCVYKLKSIGEKLIVANQLTSDLIEPDSSQVIIDLKDIQKDEGNLGIKE